MLSKVYARGRQGERGQVKEKDEEGWTEKDGIVSIIKMGITTENDGKEKNRKNRATSVRQTKPVEEEDNRKLTT